jgi:hypothetical protein
VCHRLCSYILVFHSYHNRVLAFSALSHAFIQILSLSLRLPFCGAELRNNCCRRSCHCWCIWDRKKWHSYEQTHLTRIHHLSSRLAMHSVRYLGWNPRWHWPLKQSKLERRPAVDRSKIPFARMIYSFFDSMGSFINMPTARRKSLSQN